MNTTPNFDLLDDVINSLAILRSFHRKEKDHVGAKLTTELIERVKVAMQPATKRVIEVTMDELVNAVRQVRQLDDDIELKIVDEVDEQSGLSDDEWVDIPSDWVLAGFPDYYDGDDEIMVRFRNGGTMIGYVEDFNYSQEDYDYDIVAYRPMN